MIIGVLLTTSVFGQADVDDCAVGSPTVLTLSTNYCRSWTVYLMLMGQTVDKGKLTLFSKQVIKVEVY